MMDKKQKLVPEIRFKGFTGDWEQRKLENHLEVSRQKNRDNRYDKEDVLSVSGEFGIVNQIELQGRSFAGESVANYGLVETGDIVYTKSPLKSNPYGIIKTNKGKTGIVSTLYATYKSKKCTDSKFVQIYFEQDARMNNYMQPLVNKGAKNDMKISSENALKGKVVFPELKEQQKISEHFEQLDHLITLHQRKLKLLKQLKQAYLQQMFPQNDKKVPQLRFANFSGNWEQRKLGEVADIVGGGTPSTSVAEYWNGYIDWYAPAEIGNQIYVSSSVKKISQMGLKKSSAKILPAGAILFTSRAGIGNTAILNKTGCTNQGFQSIVPHENELDSYFIFARTNELKRYGEITGAGSTFVEVSGKQMAEMPMMLPTIQEQKKIGTFFRAIDNLIVFHQKKIDSLKKIKSIYLKSMFI